MVQYSIFVNFLFIKGSRYVELGIAMSYNTYFSRKSRVKYSVLSIMKCAFSLM